MKLRLLSSTVVFAMASMLLLSCERPGATRTEATPSTANPAAAVSAPKTQPVLAGRDLAIDESMGGHTLSRHVGKSDAELAERLRREPQISAASTYTDRATAQRAVGAALDDAGTKLRSWQQRRGQRPNLVLHYRADGSQPLGRSLRRGQTASRSATRAIVVLRWQQQSNRFYVLTSYPEADR